MFHYQVLGYLQGEILHKKNRQQMSAAFSGLSLD